MNVSASKLSLLGQCQYWARDDVQREDSSSDAARIGTEVHDWIAKSLSGMDLPELSEVAKDHEPWRALELLRDMCDEYGGNPEDHAEASYAYNTADGRVRHLGNMLDRNYDISETEIAGTADVALLNDSDEVVIIDWKTGQPVDRPVENAQFLFLAACAMRTYDVDSARAIVYYTRGHYAVTDVIDSITAELFLQDVQRWIKKIPTSKPNPGPWCHERYCPARASCPAAQRSVEQVATAIATIAPANIATDEVTRDNAADMLTTIAAARDWLQGIEDRIKEVVGDDPIELPDGKLWGQIEKPRDYVVHSDVLQAAGMWITAHELDEITERKVSKKALIDTILAGAKERGEKTRGLRKRIESDLRDGGALRSKTTVSWGAYRPRKGSK